MRILLCGEGPQDIGTDQDWNAQSKTFVATEGWMQGLSRKLLGSGTEILTRTRRSLILLPKDKKKFRPLPPGHGGKSMVARIVGGTAACDIVIYMADADTPRKVEWKRKRDEINSGFQCVPNDARGIACVPMSASESWLLADTDAWIGLGLSDREDLPRNPETIWGERNDPNGNHPHRYFNRVCRAAKVPDNAETRRHLAGASKESALRSQCPISFAQFADDVTTAREA